jgi:hypothetical protein
MVFPAHSALSPIMESKMLTCCGESTLTANALEKDAVPQPDNSPKPISTVTSHRTVPN